jgi:hypothetical protein
MATGGVSLKCSGHEGIAIVIQPTTTVGPPTEPLGSMGMKTRHLLGKPCK